jgi:hypothetical protein
MAESVGPHWDLAPDRKTLTVAFPSTPPVGLQLSAASVDALIVMLGKLRAGMADLASLSGSGDCFLAMRPV